MKTVAVLCFLAGILVGTGLGWVEQDFFRDLPPRVEPARARGEGETMPLRIGDLVRLDALDAAVVVLYRDLSAIDTLDERGSLVVPDGTYARVVDYYLWNDTARIMLISGEFVGRKGITLRWNLRGLRR